MAKKVQRILLTIILSGLSIPILLRLIYWILLPGNYEADGVTDFGFGFIGFFIILPPVWLITTVLIWYLLKKYYKRKNYDSSIKMP